MLEAKNITCYRGDREFFFDISFKAGAGDAWVITGENGAGKSTLLCALANLFPLSGGEVFWEGKPILPQINEFHKSIVLLGHKLALKGRETPTEHLERWAKFRKVGTEGIPEILKFWEIENPRKHIRNYSAGQQQRIALARLMLAPRRVWLLDEPTSQLDTRGKELLKVLVDRHRAKGGAVVACTHENLGWEKCKSLDIDANKPRAKKVA